MGVIGYQPNAECAICQGLCCKRYPGCVAPEDCGEDVEAGLRALLSSGNYIIDYWEGPFEQNPEDVVGYFVRPRTVEEVGRSGIIHGAWGGKCMLLKPDGCVLEFDKRPLNCRLLKPRDSRLDRCTIEGEPKEDCIRKWLPYNALFKRIIDEWER